MSDSVIAAQIVCVMGWLLGKKEAPPLPTLGRGGAQAVKEPLKPKDSEGGIV